MTGGRHLRRQSLKLPNPASGRQREQKEDLRGKVPKRAGGQGLKGRTPKKRKHERKIPRRNTTRTRTLQTKGAEETTENKVGRQLWENEAKNNTQHRAVRGDQRKRERERERRKYSRKEATFRTEGRDTVPMPSTPPYRPTTWLDSSLWWRSVCSGQVV